MSEDYQRIEVIIGTPRRRRWTTEQKLRIIEESFEPGETVSSVARRNGVAPNLLFRWRRLMSERGAAAVGSDEPVVGNSEVRKLEARVRELERLLGRNTMENEILREALAKAEAKKTDLVAAVAAEERYPMSRVADTLRVARSNLHARVRGTGRPARTVTAWPSLSTDRGAWSLRASAAAASEYDPGAVPQSGFQSVPAGHHRDRAASDHPSLRRASPSAHGEAAWH